MSRRGWLCIISGALSATLAVGRELYLAREGAASIASCAVAAAVLSCGLTWVLLTLFIRE